MVNKVKSFVRSAANSDISDISKSQSQSRDSQIKRLRKLGKHAKNILSQSLPVIDVLNSDSDNIGSSNSNSLEQSLE